MHLLVNDVEEAVAEARSRKVEVGLGEGFAAISYRVAAQRADDRLECSAVVTSVYAVTTVTGS